MHHGDIAARGAGTPGPAGARDGRGAGGLVRAYQGGEGYGDDVVLETRTGLCRAS